MNIIPFKHQQFIELVAAGSEQDKAYIKAIAKDGTSQASARQKGSILAKRYAKEIQIERERVGKVIEAAKNKLVSDIAEKNILSTAERMEMLSKIAKGEVKIKKPFVIAGKIMEYPSEPDHNDRTKAIAELNKMDGSYAPAETKTTITDTRPPSTVTMPDGTKIEI
jgi:hypothetical protein